AAAVAAAQPRGGSRPSKWRPKPPEPIEVVFARVNKEVVGALLLRRKWMEQVFDESEDNDDQPSRKADSLSDWLGLFGRQLGRSIVTEIDLVEAQLWMQTPEDCLDVL